MNDILLIRFSSLGDVVLATAVLEALKSKYPESRIHFMTKNEYSGLFCDDSRIYELVTMKSGDSPKNIVKRSGRKSFDAVIDLHGTLRSRMVAALIKSPCKVMLNKHAAGRRLMIWSRNKFRRKYDVLKSYLDTVKPLDIEEKGLPCLKISNDTLHSGQVILDLKCAGFTDKYIGFAPGAKHSEKRWNEKSFASLADKLAKSGYMPVFIGDFGDIDVVGRIRSCMKEKSVSLAGEIDISMTLGVIVLLKAIITNDSAPMHIAGALGTPFVSIFGPTHPDLGFVPGYPSGKVLHSGVACSPCSLHGEKKCRMKKRFCMDKITVDMVFEEINRMF